MTAKKILDKLLQLGYIAKKGKGGFMDEYIEGLVVWQQQ